LREPVAGQIDQARDVIKHLQTYRLTCILEEARRVIGPFKQMPQLSRQI